MSGSILNRWDERSWMWIITLLSVTVVGVVAFLIYQSQGITDYHPAIYILPKLNAFLNSSVTVFLITGFIYIRRKNIAVHRLMMMAAFVFSIIFLLSYLTYHYQAPETKFGDLNRDGVLDVAEKSAAGASRYIYYFILLTHIVLAMSIVPLALITLFRAWVKDYRRHRKIARWTLPIWLYVSITGVIVYLMISQYYPS